MRIGYELCIYNIISSWSNSDKIVITQMIQRLSGEPVAEVVENESRKYELHRNWPIAFRFLDARSDAEYERISIEEVE